jgi:hypothetical protein
MNLQIRSYLQDQCMLTQSVILTCKRESKQLNYNNKLFNTMKMHVQEIKRITKL